MRKFIGISFNYTYRLHLVLVIRIYFDKKLIYPEIGAAQILVKKKSSSQVSNLLNMLNTKYYIKCSSKYINPRDFLFFLHDFKLNTEVSIE